MQIPPSTNKERTAMNPRVKRPRLLESSKRCKKDDKAAWFWSSTFDANDPSEDRHVCCPNVQIDSLKCDKAHIFLVCDGHGGSLCADFVIEHLPLQVVNELNRCDDLDESRARENIEDFQNDISKALKSAFVKIDVSWLEKIGANNSKRASQKACKKNGKWSVGTCALLVLILDFGLNDRVMFTAHSGDVRACLFSSVFPMQIKDHDSVFDIDVLTEDHNVKNQKEVVRMREECIDPNPIRPNKLNEMRVAGSLIPTRAFGGKNYAVTFSI